MLSSAKWRQVLSGALGVASLALFARGAAYYAGSGPHDGDDLPSFVTFLAASTVLFAAVLTSWSPRLERRGRWLVGLCISGGLLVMAFVWWVFNVMLEQWASSRSKCERRRPC